MLIRLEYESFNISPHSIHMLYEKKKKRDEFCTIITSSCWINWGCMHLKFFMKMQCVYLYLIYIRSISMHNCHRHLLIWDVCPGGKETWIKLLMNLILDVPEFMSMTVQWCHFVDCGPRIPRQWGGNWH